MNKRRKKKPQKFQFNFEVDHIRVSVWLRRPMAHVNRNFNSSLRNGQNGFCARVLLDKTLRLWFQVIKERTLCLDGPSCHGKVFDTWIKNKKQSPYCRPIPWHYDLPTTGKISSLTRGDHCWHLLSLSEAEEQRHSGWLLQLALRAASCNVSIIIPTRVPNTEKMYIISAIFINVAEIIYIIWGKELM